MCNKDLQAAGQAWHVRHPWPEEVTRPRLNHVPADHVLSLLSLVVNAHHSVQSAVFQGVTAKNSAGSLPRDSTLTPTRFPSVTRPTTAPVRQSDRTGFPALKTASVLAVVTGMSALHI